MEETCNNCGCPADRHTGLEGMCRGCVMCAGMCPGPNCPECSGERCNIHQFDPCECDSARRHDRLPPAPAAQGKGEA